MLSHLNLNHSVIARIDSLIASQHEANLYRPTAAALLVSPKGMVLVGKSAKPKGRWSLLQGGIKPGESAVVALFRELGEEASLDPANVSECRFCYAVCRKKECPPDGFTEGMSYFIFHVQCHTMPQLSLKTDEVSKCEWLQPLQVDDVLAEGASAEKRQLVRAAMQRAGLL